VALVSLPWLVKNAVFTGNPFYPFIFPTETFPALRLDYYQGVEVWGGIENLLFLPWMATITGVELREGFSASIGPMLLALGGLSWIGWQGRGPGQKRVLAGAWTFSMAGLILWAVLGRLSGFLVQSRLYFSIFPVFGFLAGAGFESLRQLKWPGVRMGRIASAALLLVFGLNLLDIADNFSGQQVLPYFFGQVSEEAYLDNSLGMYSLAMRGIKDLGDEARVRMLWEPRAAYCLPQCEPDEILDAWHTKARETGYDSEAIIEDWKAQGFTHLLYFRMGQAFYREDPRFEAADWELLDATLAGLELVLDLNHIYEIYEIP